MTRRPVVLVTGAGGFIGGRLVEVLHASGVADVRAGVRRWASAALVGRLPVLIVHCDVMDPQSLRAAMDGVDAVVHCAVGEGATNAAGTRHVLEAAADRGVERVVHLSTIDVYGQVEGRCDESRPRLRNGRAYGDSKIEAEEVCEEFRARGLPVTILRPTIVYGPGSTLWTVEFAERLAAGTLQFAPEDSSGTCNLVYVDDVVGAVVRALRVPTPVSETFNVNGPDAMTWGEYFRALNAAMGLPPLRDGSRGRTHLTAAVMAPAKRAAKWALRTMPGLVMGVYQRSKLARRVMKRVETSMRQAPNANEFRLYSLKADFPTERLQTNLGYRPIVRADDGIAMSVQWLRHHGIGMNRG